MVLEPPKNDPGEGHLVYAVLGSLVGFGGFVVTIAAPFVLEKNSYAAAGTAVGSFFVAIGGVIFSLAVSHVQAKMQARTELNAQLQQVGRQVNTVSAQLQGTVDVAAELEPNDLIRILHDRLISLNAIMVEIGILTGRRPDVEEFAQNFAAIRDYVEKMRSRQDSESDEEEDASEATEVLNRLSLLETKVAIPLQAKIPSQKVSAEVSCPSCNQETTVMVGPVRGDTGAGQCHLCKQWFNAHRAQDDSVFTRHWGIAPQPTMLGPKITGEVLCPKCKNPVTFHAPTGSRGTVQRYCFVDLLILEIDPLQREVKSSKPATVIEGKSVEENAGAFWMKCPEHTSLFRRLNARNGFHIGECPVDKKLVRVPYSPG